MKAAVDVVVGRRVMERNQKTRREAGTDLLYERIVPAPNRHAATQRGDGPPVHAMFNRLYTLAKVKQGVNSDRRQTAGGREKKQNRRRERGGREEKRRAEREREQNKMVRGEGGHFLIFLSLLPQRHWPQLPVSGL